MSTYTTAMPAAPNLVATLFGPLAEIIDPLLDDAPAMTDPGVPELLKALGEALTAAVRVTRAAPAAASAPMPVRPAAVRTGAARVTSAQVGSVAGEPKPGSLRARLIGYLAEHPGREFTVTELFHGVGATSGGAVGAALNTMTAHGEAIQTSDAPKRFTAPAGTVAPAPAEPDADTDQDTAPDTADEPDTGETADAIEHEANTDADTDDEPGPDADADTDTDTDTDADADQDSATDADATAPEDAPAPATARATRRAKTRR